MRETEIIVEQKNPQGVLVCDHAGLVINKFSLQGLFAAAGVDVEWTDYPGETGAI